MNCKLWATLLLIGSSGALLISATEYQVNDYVDVSRFAPLSDLLYVAVGQLFDRNLDEDPETSATKLASLLETLQKAKKDDGAKNELDLGGFDARDIDTISDIMGELSSLADGDCHQFIMKNLFKTINFVFGKDLQRFVHLAPTRYVNLHTFLLHFTRKTISKCLQAAVESDVAQSHYEDDFDKMVARDPELVIGRHDHELLGLAKQLDLLRGKFKAREMLNAVERYSDRKSISGVKAHKRFFNKLVVLCAGIDHFTNRSEIYNLAILLVPDQASKVSPSERFLKLNEYSRICSPLRNPRLSRILYGNIKQNLPTVGKLFKDLVKSRAIEVSR